MRTIPMLAALMLLAAMSSAQVWADDMADRNAKAGLRRAEQEAQDAQAVVSRREAEIARLAEEFKKHSGEARASVGDLAKETVAWETARKVIPELKKEARWLADNQDTLANKLRLLRAALEKASTAYREAAKAYAARAEQEDEDEIKAGYLEMASWARKLADAMEAKGKRLDGTQGDVAKKLRFVEKSIGFLDDLEGFLAIYEPVRQQDAEMQQYLRRVNTYCKNFEQALRSVWTLTDAVISNTEETGSKAASPASRAPAPMPVRPAGTEQPSGSGRPSIPESRSPESRVNPTTTVRGTIVRIVSEPGTPDVCVLNLGRRQGLATGTPVVLYRNGALAARATIGALGNDLACIDCAAGRFGTGDTVVVAFTPQRQQTALAHAPRP